MHDDRTLWGRAVQGDGQAFGTLFERHAKAVFGYCLRRTADWTVAEDCTSVVFLEAWRRRGSVALSGSSILPWLYGVALGVTRNHRRALGRYHRALTRIPPAGPAGDHADRVAERLDAEANVRAVNRELSRLPRREREVVEACAWLGLTHSEAADMLNIPIGTVKSRLERAKCKLRQASDILQEGATR